MGSEGVEDRRRHTAVTSQNGCLKAWSKSRGTRGIALDGKDVCHVRLIITPGGITKKKSDKDVALILNLQCMYIRMALECTLRCCAVQVCQFYLTFARIHRNISYYPTKHISIYICIFQGDSISLSLKGSLCALIDTLAITSAITVCKCSPDA